MNLTEAREAYENGEIDFETLYSIFFDKATKDEMKLYIKCPLWDKDKFIKGMSQSEMDSQWNEFIKNEISK